MNFLPLRPATHAFSGPRVWLIPLAAASCLALLALSGANQALFLALNGAASHLPGWLWADLTVLGDTTVAFALMLPFARRRPDIAAAIILTAVITTLIVHGVKPALNLPRPPAVLDHGLFQIIGPAYRSGSFPSGHTSTAFALVALLGAYVSSRRMLVALVLLAVLVGASRIAVGVHWPMDVLGGMLAGWLSGLAGVALAQRCSPCRSRPAFHLIQALLLTGTVLLISRYDSGYPEAERLEQAIAFAALALFFRPMPKESVHG